MSKINKKLVLGALLSTLEDVKNPKEKVSVIHSSSNMIDAAVMKTRRLDAGTVIHYEGKENSRLVAVVEVDKSLSIEEKLDIAFVKTNSIDEAWWDNKEVTAMFPDESCRSTSVGDMVLIGKVKYKCEAVGWSVV